MYSKLTLTSAWYLLGAGIIASTCLVGNVAAKDHQVNVSVQVSRQGLDLSQPADAQKFYTRLKNAAWLVCTRGTRADLVPSDDLRGCYEKSLADAVRSAQTPLLTQLWLASHTLQEAAARGIDASAQFAAK